MSDPRYYANLHTGDVPTPEEEEEASEWMQRDYEVYQCLLCKERWAVEGWFPPDVRFGEEPSGQFADMFCPISGEDVFCPECEIEGSR